MLYLVMELVDGRSLDALIAERPRRGRGDRIGDEVLQAGRASTGGHGQARRLRHRQAARTTSLAERRLAVAEATRHLARRGAAGVGGRPPVRGSVPSRRQAGRRRSIPADGCAGSPTYGIAKPSPTSCAADVTAASPRDPTAMAKYPAPAEQVRCAPRWRRRTDRVSDRRRRSRASPQRLGTCGGGPLAAGSSTGGTAFALGATPPSPTCRTTRRPRASSAVATVIRRAMASTHGWTAPPDADDDARHADDAGPTRRPRLERRRAAGALAAIPPASASTPRRSPAACRASTTAAGPAQRRDLGRATSAIARTERRHELASGGRGGAIRDVRCP